MYRVKCCLEKTLFGVLGLHLEAVLEGSLLSGVGAGCGAGL